MTTSLSLPSLVSAPGPRRAGLWLGRLVWLALMLGTLALFASGLPLRYEDLRQRYQAQPGLTLYRNRFGQAALSVWVGFPAEQAGILAGDVLLAINGVPITLGADQSPDSILPAGAAGSTLTLSVQTGALAARDIRVSYGGENALALARLGVSAGFIPLYTLTIEIVLALCGLALSAYIVWRRQADRLALLLSLSLVLAQLGASAPVIALYNAQPLWRPTLDAWFAFALAAWQLFFYLFPDGHFRPRATAALTLLAAAWWGVQCLFPSLYPWRLPAPYGFLIILAWLASGVLAQAYRYARHSDAVQRQQTKWVLLGLTAASLGALGQLAPIIWPLPAGQASLLYDLAGYPLTQVLRVLLPVSLGLAILRYRLWDIDLILNRTLVYGGLTVSVIAIYVLCVSVLGALIQSGATGLLSILATGLVAVLVQPVRDRLQRGVNRLIYGERDDPVTVLNRLGRRLEASLTPEALLPSLAETVAQALKLPYVAIEIARSGTAPEVVAYPAGGRAAPETRALPLLHQGEPVGRLLVAPRAPGEAFSPLDQHLLENIARQAGLAVHAVSLTRELQRARQRLVAALEDERRRLRRDLHDGLGPALASQGLKLAAARQHLRGNPDAALALIDGVLEQNHETVADVRRLVYGLRPPALDERGLAEAIRDHLGQGPAGSLRVTVDDLPAGAPPLPAAVEVAAYRIALEALTNIIKHARARTGSVRFAIGPQAPTPVLQIEIEDDGAGLPAALRAGVGLRSMRERAEELGGTLQMETGAAGGTRVVAVLPTALAAADSLPATDVLGTGDA